MYLLKYLENSDAICQSSTTSYILFKDCARQMKEEYEKVRKFLGIREEELPAPSEDDKTGAIQRVSGRMRSLSS